MPHGRSDRDYPSERPRHPREHPVVPRGNWREDQERYYRRSNVRRYSSDEDGVLHKENTLVKSSVKVVNRVRKIVRSRSASPRDKGKARITTVKRVSSETKFMPERVKPRRKSAEVKGSDVIKAKRYVHKFLPFGIVKMQQVCCSMILLIAGWLVVCSVVNFITGSL